MPVTKQGKVEYTDQEREYRDYMKGIKAPSRHTREQPMNREQALEYLRKVDDARRNLTTKEVESLGYAPGGAKERQALQVIRDSKKNEKRKGGPIHKKAEMMGGGMYKSKKHSYATGGMVKDMNIMRTK